MRTIADYLGFLQLTWKDAIEIVLVAYLIYRILVLWTGTRAFQILVGLVLLVAVYAMAQLFQFGLISYILSQVFTYGAFALIVVFQPELRNALAQLGRSRLWNLFGRLEERQVVEEIVKAAERLSRAKIGALIAVEGDVGLAEYADTGTRFEADVSADLLMTIFTPYSPLHDGAVIVEGDKIIAAGAALPLTQFPVRDKSLGMRHRAAIGLSEETDAYVVVISEETSQISLAAQGQLFRGLDQERLRAHLVHGKLGPPPPPGESRWGRLEGIAFPGLRGRSRGPIDSVTTSGGIPDNVVGPASEAADRASEVAETKPPGAGGSAADGAPAAASPSGN